MTAAPWSGVPALYAGHPGCNAIAVEAILCLTLYSAPAPYLMPPGVSWGSVTLPAHPRWGIIQHRMSLWSWKISQSEFSNVKPVQIQSNSFLFLCFCTLSRVCYLSHPSLVLALRSVGIKGPFVLPQLLQTSPRHPRSMWILSPLTRCAPTVSSWGGTFIEAMKMMIIGKGKLQLWCGIVDTTICVSSVFLFICTMIDTKLEVVFLTHFPAHRTEAEINFMTCGGALKYFMFFIFLFLLLIHIGLNPFTRLFTI